MNCIPETDIPPITRSPGTGRIVPGLRALAAVATLSSASLLHGCGVSVPEAAAQTPAERGQYRLEFVVTPDRSATGAAVKMQLSQSGRQLREVRMRIDPDRIGNVRANGHLRVTDDLVIWQPPEGDGMLEWFASMRHKRNGKSYDAYIGADWAVFRAEDLIPRATTRSLKAASSETWLSFRLPVGWSSVTPYFGRDHRYRISNPERRFDLPTGWIALGKIGVRNDTIAGIRVKVAGPMGHDIRRMDMLAMLHWTLAEFQRVLPSFPQRLTIVSAADPMWRGGLSAPRSLYIHSSRPLISENATSTLLHEVFHVGFGPLSADRADWIIEGLAEYYSLQILARSGTISDGRLKIALASQADWGKSVANICTMRSYGAGTARSVTIFAELDDEIRKTTRNRHSLDDVIRELASSDEKVTLEALREIVVGLTGKTSNALSSKKLPGCDTQAEPA
jgi:hypothetical protein